MNVHRRKRLPHGIHERPDRATVVFVTVCTADRGAWLADDAVHALLCDIWREACGWLVGRYLMMPDHIHYFACPGDRWHSLEQWEHYWKHVFGLRINDVSWRFQDDHWDTRMRNGRQYEEKWAYVLDNPVRKGLVEEPEDWPFAGIIHEWAYFGP